MALFVGLRGCARVCAVQQGLLTRSFSSSAPALENKKDVIGVVGLGLMGHGIAQVAAASGYQVRALEMNSDFLQTGLGRIRGSLEKVYKKKFENPEDALHAFNETYGRITPTTHMSDLSDCDLVVEATTENLDLKHSVFSALHEVVKPSCIFASNTSSLSITEIAAGSGRPELTLGMHFFNPVQIMKLVEVIEGEQTTPEAFALAHAFVKDIKKIPVKCKDSPGFIVNRLLVPYLAQAVALYERGEASIVDIDAGMKFGAGHPMGPIMLADYVGLDTTLFILEGWVKNHPNEPAFFIPESLKQKVAEGKFGRKSGEGYYKWNGDAPVVE
uniref:3-hydroxyacyl-CoA dehydrogenase n=1 Tax=Paramoeba aestuarina TaxID=180227 RepID=A0A7S4PD71_9EUKA